MNTYQLLNRHPTDTSSTSGSSTNGINSNNPMNRSNIFINPLNIKRSNPSKSQTNNQHKVIEYLKSLKLIYARNSNNTYGFGIQCMKAINTVHQFGNIKTVQQFHQLCQLIDNDDIQKKLIKIQYKLNFNNNSIIKSHNKKFKHKRRKLLTKRSNSLLDLSRNTNKVNTINTRKLLVQTIQNQKSKSCSVTNINCPSISSSCSPYHTPRKMSHSGNKRRLNSNDGTDYYKKCKLCGKRFLNNIRLTEHMIIHRKDKPFRCSECGKRFKNKMDLKQHYIYHKRAIRFGCLYPNCDKEFRQEYKLKQHLMMHKRNLV